MSGSRWTGAGLAVTLVLVSAPLQAQQADIESALSAAPPEIARGAAVMGWDNTELKAGSNGWTCFPDVPDTPGEDPTCLDAEWMKWAGAWQAKSNPDITQVGFAYMLAGGTDASNTDPFATEPKPGEDWVHSGPHVMIIVPDPELIENFTTDPDKGGPWVMWKGTPYAHIMVPVAGM